MTVEIVERKRGLVERARLTRERRHLDRCVPRGVAPLQQIFALIGLALIPEGFCRELLERRAQAARVVLQLSQLLAPGAAARAVNLAREQSLERLELAR
eukprot:CAMPEP_0179961540 /NCGR_PEP_ID=MMETSP0983-20121128/29746_1 /TAXON_ID=483367 /ORGANISM="non described non described, Strain CCMP 2436" /LENGTH=98 /DNA_ID=CAMNT_0021873999 /DNA_START=367 /DNA_END=663 /DNA_ORIENTATION=+